MAEHRFKPGERVHLTRPFPDRSGSGLYEIVRLLPESVEREPLYRIRGQDKIERAAPESQLARPDRR